MSEPLRLHRRWWGGIAYIGHPNGVTRRQAQELKSAIRQEFRIGLDLFRPILPQLEDLHLLGMLHTHTFVEWPTNSDDVNRSTVTELVRVEAVLARAAELAGGADFRPYQPMRILDLNRGRVIENPAFDRTAIIEGANGDTRDAEDH